MGEGVTAGGLMRRFADCCAGYIHTVPTYSAQCTQYEICRSCLIIQSITRPAKIYRSQTPFPFHFPFFSPLPLYFPSSSCITYHLLFTFSFSYLHLYSIYLSPFPFPPFLLLLCPLFSFPFVLITYLLLFTFSLPSLQLYSVSFPLPVSHSLFPYVPYFLPLRL